jgi:hypothetical protein
VPEDRQRLIYRGRVLHDQSPLNEYKIEDGHTVHMVAKPPDYEDLQSRISAQEAAAAGALSSQTGSSSQSALQSLLALTGDPFMQSLGRPGMGIDPRNDASATGSSFEPIRQGLLTMHTLLSTTEAIPRPRPPPTAAALTEGASTRKFYVGQWLDVKDTVNQWLEATVMDINAGEQKLFIHYNGW